MAKLKSKIIGAVRIDNAQLGRVLGDSLKKLRELTGFTQKQLAKRLSVGQAAISKLESRSDVQLSSLHQYVEALGATLRVEATFSPDKAPQAVRDLSAGLADDDQLVFPLLAELPRSLGRDIVLSINPRYSEKIIQGSKTVELRRRFPLTAKRGTRAYIYSTSPVMAVVGGAEILNVFKLPISDLWKQHGKSAQITRGDFDDYFAGTSEGFAICLTKARPFNRAFELSELRNKFGFEPPQSFIYAAPRLRKVLENEYTNVSD